MPIGVEFHTVLINAQCPYRPLRQTLHEIVHAGERRIIWDELVFDLRKVNLGIWERSLPVRCDQFATTEIMPNPAEPG